jgi:membrane-associated PAP2 superfamily phosphatase
MSQWTLPVLVMLGFVVVFVVASRLVWKVTGRSFRRSRTTLATVAVGIVVAISLLEALVALDRPWQAVLAGGIAGLLNLAAQALFGVKTSSPVDVSAGAERLPARTGESR